MAPSLVRLYEMPRTRGALSPHYRAALERARREGGEFSTRDFLRWTQEAGGGTVNTEPNSAAMKFVARHGEPPDAFHPLVVTRPGVRGRYGTETLLKYAYDGPAGAPSKAPPPKEEPPEGPTAAEPEPDEDEVDGADDLEPEDDPDMSSPPQWLPQPDWDGDMAEAAMDRLNEKGFGPNNPIWMKVAGAENDLAVGQIIQHLPVQLRRDGVAVAKAIFRNLNKDWEKGTKMEPLPKGHPDSTLIDPRPAPKAGPTRGQSPKPKGGGAGPVIRRRVAGEAISVSAVYGMREPVDFNPEDGAAKAARMGSAKRDDQDDGV